MNARRLSLPQGTAAAMILAFLALPGCSATLDVTADGLADRLGGLGGGTAAAGPTHEYSSVLFETDFSDTAPGGFPADMEFVRGSWTVTDQGGDRLLAATTGSSGFRVRLDEPLPERFSVELSLAYSGGSGGRLQSGIGFGEAGGMWDFQGHWVGFNRSYIDIREDRNALVTYDEADLGSLTPLRVEVDGSRLQVFLDGEHVAEIPGATIVRSSGVIEFRLTGSSDEPAYISNLRITEAG